MVHGQVPLVRISFARTFARAIVTTVAPVSQRGEEYGTHEAER